MDFEELKANIIRALEKIVNGELDEDVKHIYGISNDKTKEIFEWVKDKLGEGWNVTYLEAVRKCNNINELLYTIAVMEFMRGYTVGRYDQLIEDIKRERERQSLMIGEGGAI